MISAKGHFRGFDFYNTKFSRKRGRINFYNTKYLKIMAITPQKELSVVTSLACSFFKKSEKGGP